VGLILGPILFLAVLLVPMDMPLLAHRCLAIAVWIATWWITEAVPLAVTSLLPLILIPLMGIDTAQSAATPYANNTVILFMGGFIIAQSIVRWNLHHRLALLIVNVVGTSPRKIVFGFMAAAGILSMFISNTAAAVALMPVGLSVSNLVAEEIKEQNLPLNTGPGKFNFGISLMLGIAFAASIGGLGTPIGSPPNLIFIGTLQQLYPDIEVSFVNWMIFGVPMVFVFIPVVWLVLVTVFKPGFKEIPGGKELMRAELKKLGPWSRGEKAVLWVFASVALMWILRPFVINPFVSELIHDSTIAIIGAVLLFVIPISWEKGTFAMDWGNAAKIPWDVLLLFGGGLSLAQVINSSGLASWLGDQMIIVQNLSPFLIVLVIGIFASFLSEVTSNTATAAMLMPIMAALAAAIGMSPIATMLAAAISVSIVFMLPVGTPPNAVVYSSGYLNVTSMIRGGILSKIILLPLAAIAVYFLALPLISSFI
jgi:solute carrier family 13 (sodium-dependent dicarboxylate transporter), member 2/3/5